MLQYIIGGRRSRYKHYSLLSQLVGYEEISVVNMTLGFNVIKLFVRNLRIFVVSYSVCLWPFQASPMFVGKVRSITN